MKAEVVALHRSGDLKNEFEMSVGMGYGCAEASHHGQLPRVLTLLRSSFGLCGEVCKLVAWQSLAGGANC